MTIFTPYTGAPKDPSYLGYSTAPGAIDADTSTATAIKGLTDLSSNALTGLDELNKIDIKKELFSKIEAERNASVAAGKSLLDVPGGRVSSDRMLGYTSPDLSGNKADYSEASLPAGAQAGIRQINKMVQANKQGQMDDVHFYGNIQTAIQNLTFRYQGYGPEIRQTANALLGEDSGVKLREEIQKSINELVGHGKSAQEKWLTEIHSDQKYFGDNPEGKQMFQRALAAKSEDEKMAVRMHLQTMKAAEYELDRDYKRIQVKEAQGKSTSEDYTATLHRDLSNTQRTMLTNLTVAVNGYNWKWDDVQNAFREMTSDTTGAPDPQKKATLGMALGKFGDAMDNIIDDKFTNNQFNKKVQPDGTEVYTDSYGSIIKDAPKVNAAMKEQYGGMFRTMAKQIGEGNTKLATVYAEIIKSTGESNSLKLLANKLFQQIQAVEKVAGGQMGAKILETMLTANNWKDLSDVSKILSGMNAIDLVNNPKFEGLGKILTNYETVSKEASGGDVGNDATSGEGGTPKVPANYIKANIDTVKQFIINKDTPMQDKVRVANMITDPKTYGDFLSKFNTRYQIQAWARIADPEISAAIKAQGPEQWDKYRTWSEKTFVRLFQNYRDTFMEDGIDQKTVTDVKFNPETQQVDFKRVIAGKVYGPDDVQPRVSANTAVLSMQRMNIGLKTLSNILALDGEKITPEYLGKLGLDLSHKQTDGFMDQMIKAFVTYHKSTVSEPLKKAVEGLPDAPIGTLGTPELFTKPQKINYSPEDKKTLKEFLDNPDGMPVYHQGKREVIRNSPDTPVKNIQDDKGNEMWVVQKGGKWYKIIPSR